MLPWVQKRRGKTHAYKYKNLDSMYLGESGSEKKKATTEVSLQREPGFKRPFPYIITHSQV